jgi:hypothetical protein
VRHCDPLGPVGLHSSSDELHRLGDRPSQRRRFQFTDHRKEMLYSRAHNQTRPMSALRSNCHEWPSHSFSIFRAGCGTAHVIDRQNR